MSEIDVSKCEYKGGIECHIRDYPILNCADVKIKDCYYKQLQQLKAENESYQYQLEKRVEICEIWYNLANKYKECIDEIEGIINKSCKECMSEFLNEDYCSEGDCFKILQKIKEVKGE